MKNRCLKIKALHIKYKGNGQNTKIHKGLGNMPLACPAKPGLSLFHFPHLQNQASNPVFVVQSSVGFTEEE